MGYMTLPGPSFTGPSVTGPFRTALISGESVDFRLGGGVMPFALLSLHLTYVTQG